MKELPEAPAEARPVLRTIDHVYEVDFLQRLKGMTKADVLRWLDTVPAVDQTHVLQQLKALVTGFYFRAIARYNRNHG